MRTVDDTTRADVQSLALRLLDAPTQLDRERVADAAPAPLLLDAVALAGCYAGDCLHEH